MTCLSSNQSTCTSCYNQSYLINNTCSASCTNGYYPDTSSGYGVCLMCQPPCLLCSSVTYCLSCIDTSLFLVNGSCLGCLAPCLTCATQRSACTSCDTSSTFKYLYNSSCNSDCLSGSYPSSSQCLQCQSPCATCSNTSTCLSCLAGFYELGPTCVSICPNGYFNNITQCSLCISPCVNCSSLGICTACNGSYYLLYSSCVSNCPNGTSIINGNVCVGCDSQCMTCSQSNTSSCTSCHNNTYLFNYRCITTCVNSTYPDIINRVCQVCIPPCLYCTNSTYCLSCRDVALFLVNGSCVGCSSICRTCTVTTTNCTSCENASTVPYLYNYTCLASCPGGYYG